MKPIEHDIHSKQVTESQKMNRRFTSYTSLGSLQRQPLSCKRLSIFPLYRTDIIKNYEIFEQAPFEQKKIFKNELLHKQGNQESQKNMMEYYSKIKELSHVEQLPYRSQTFKQPIPFRKKSVNPFLENLKIMNNLKNNGDLMDDNQSQIRRSNSISFLKMDTLDCNNIRISRNSGVLPLIEELNQIYKRPSQGSQERNKSTQNHQKTLKKEEQKKVKKQETAQSKTPSKQLTHKSQKQPNKKDFVKKTRSIDEDSTKKQEKISQKSKIKDLVNLLEEKKFDEVDLILEEIIVQENPEKKVKVLKAVAQFYQENSQLDKAVKTLEKAKICVDGCDKKSSESILPQVLLKLAELYLLSQNREEALKTLNHPILEESSEYSKPMQELRSQIIQQIQPEPVQMIDLEENMVEIIKNNASTTKFQKIVSLIERVIDFQKEYDLEQQSSQLFKIINEHGGKITSESDSKNKLINHVLNTAFNKRMNWTVCETLKQMLNKSFSIGFLDADQKKNLLKICIESLDMFNKRENPKNQTKLLILIILLSKDLTNDSFKSVQLDFNLVRCYIDLQKYKLVFQSFNQLTKTIHLFSESQQNEILKQIYPLVDLLDEKQHIRMAEFLNQLVKKNLPLRFKKELHEKIGLIYFQQKQFKHCYEHYKEHFEENLSIQENLIYELMCLLSSLKLKESLFNQQLAKVKEVQLTNQRVLSFSIQTFINTFQTTLSKTNRNELNKVKHELFLFFNQKEGERQWRNFWTIIDKYFCEVSLLQKESKNEIFRLFPFENKNFADVQLFIAQFYFLLRCGALMFSQWKTEINLKEVYDQFLEIRDSESLKQFIQSECDPIDKESQGKQSETNNLDEIKQKSPYKENPMMFSSSQGSSKGLPFSKTKNQQERKIREKIEEKLRKMSSFGELGQSNNAAISQEIENFIMATKKQSQKGNQTDFKTLFDQFEKKLESERKKLGKFTYLKEIVQIWYLIKDNPSIDQKKYDQSVKKIFLSQSIGLNDIKKILNLKECFKDGRAVIAFFKFLQSYEVFVFEESFTSYVMEPLNNRYQKTIKELYDQVDTPSKKVLTSCPLFRWFDCERTQQELQVTVPQVTFELRNIVIFEKSLHEHLLQKMSNKYTDFLAKLYFLDTIKKIREQKLDSQQIFEFYAKSISKSLIGKQTNNLIDIPVQIYYILKCLNLSLEECQVIGEEVVQILFEIRDKIPQTQRFFFSCRLDSIGNYFYTKNDSLHCINCKSMVFEEIMKVTSIQEQEIKSPFELQTLEDIIFSVFSFFFVNQMNHGEISLALKCVKKIKSFENKSSFQSLLFLCMEAFFCLLAKYQDKFDKLRECLEEEDLALLSVREKSLLSYLKYYLFNVSLGPVQEERNNEIEKMLKNLK